MNESIQQKRKIRKKKEKSIIQRGLNEWMKSWLCGVPYSKIKEARNT